MKITEQKVLGLLFMLYDRIGDVDRRYIIEFTDANEHGLAFDQLVLVMCEDEKPLSGYEYAVIDSLYRYFGDDGMGVDYAKMAELKRLVRT